MNAVPAERLLIVSSDPQEWQNFGKNNHMGPSSMKTTNKGIAVGFAQTESGPSLPRLTRRRNVTPKFLCSPEKG